MSVLAQPPLPTRPQPAELLAPIAPSEEPQPSPKAVDVGDDGATDPVGRDGDDEPVQVIVSSSTRGVEELASELSVEDSEAPWENRVREAADRDGETVVTAGPMLPSQSAGMQERLAQVAAMVACDTTLLHEEAHPAQGTTPARVTTYSLVRKQPGEDHHLDLRVAVVGNVDAGKSTLVGVLTGPVSFLDDGRGLARSRVLRHKHEAETGRTSSIAEDQHMRLNTHGDSLATERHHKSSAAAEAADTAKVVSFIDLAGHEKYLRTTVYGLTAHEPDYVMVVVGANHGITRMTKEHVGMAIALNVPLFVVVTKVDLCPEPVLKETMKQLTRLLKLPGARKQPYAIRDTHELMRVVQSFGKSAVTPVFSISSVSGVNVPLLRQFFNLMPSRKVWAESDHLPAEFLIDQFFNVAGALRTSTAQNANTDRLLPPVSGRQQLLATPPTHPARLTHPPRPSQPPAQPHPTDRPARHRNPPIAACGHGRRMTLRVASTVPPRCWPRRRRHSALGSRDPQHAAPDGAKRAGQVQRGHCQEHPPHARPGVGAPAGPIGRLRGPLEDEGACAPVWHSEGHGAA